MYGSDDEVARRPFLIEVTDLRMDWEIETLMKKCVRIVGA
jgi:hypothetical protein